MDLAARMLPKKVCNGRSETGDPSRKPVFQGGSLMTGTNSIPTGRIIFPAVEQTEQTELVKGNEQKLLARVSPLVRQQSVTLDLHRIERIDAAGISALLSLYASARAAGHFFTVTNLSPHVSEILALVGLQRILLYRNADRESQSGICFAGSAA
jgi:anti-anti-sigma factor